MKDKTPAVVKFVMSTGERIHWFGYVMEAVEADGNTAITTLGRLGEVLSDGTPSAVSVMLVSDGVEL